MDQTTPKPNRTTHTTHIEAAGAETREWWQTGVIYQLYVRSFYDTNGDGVGDLPGVIEKLDYLEDLGISAIWLSPVTVSSNFDWGYDVMNYTDIDPALGTMKDFDRLVKDAHHRGIKVIVDFVPNHTSIKHPWFQDALKSKHSKYRDYYIWANPKKDGRPPNNWKASNDGGSAWEYHAPTGQYYLHNFFKQQADLNWRNPKVLEEFDNVLKFWLDKGVDGFRLDVFNMIIKDQQLRDNPKSEKGDDFEIRLYGQRPVYNTSRPEAHDILKRWRRMVDSYPQKAVLLGETNRVYDMKQMASFYGDNDEIKLIFNLAFMQSPFNARRLKAIVEKTQEGLGETNWPAWVGSNHDRPRFPSFWANGDERKIRCALTIILGLRGTAVLYYGDELGLEDVFVAPWRLKDPQGKKYWPVEAGRDRARSPMPWLHKLGAGFTKEDVRPWLPYGELRHRNVERQSQEENSTLAFTKNLIALRRDNAELNAGSYETIDTAPEVWAWKRGENTIVAINMSDHHHEIRGMTGTMQISTEYGKEGIAVEGLLHLSPWEGVILKTA